METERHILFVVYIQSTMSEAACRVFVVKHIVNKSLAVFRVALSQDVFDSI